MLAFGIVSLTNTEEIFPSGYPPMSIVITV